MKVRFCALIVLLVALACSSSEPISSSSQQFTAAAAVTYTNMPTGSDHFATTTSVTIPDPSCDLSLRTTVAWEEEQLQGSDVPAEPLWLATECGFNPISVTGGAAVSVNTGLTGVPPEWTKYFGGAPMLYLKEPVLVPITQSENQPWIVMLAQVGPTYGDYRAIATALSLDGGQTWSTPHLVQQFGDTNSGFVSPGVDDLAAANSFRPDVETNISSGICPPGSMTCTDDIFVTWTFQGQRFYNFVSYFQNTDGVWDFARNPSSPTLAMNLGGVWPFSLWPSA